MSQVTQNALTDILMARQMQTSPNKVILSWDFRVRSKGDQR